MPETYLLPAEAAHALRITVKTLTQWRWQGKGPPYVRVAGNLIRYAQSALDAWMAAQCVPARDVSGDDPLPPPPTPRAAVHALPPKRRASRAKY